MGVLSILFGKNKKQEPKRQPPRNDGRAYINVDDVKRDEQQNDLLNTLNPVSPFSVWGDTGSKSDIDTGASFNGFDGGSGGGAGASGDWGSSSDSGSSYDSGSSSYDSSSSSSSSFD